MGGALIAVAGMMGSGKTTLSRALAAEIGWTVLPEGLRTKGYLTDLFKDQERWAFDVQVGFLTEKAIRLKNLLLLGKNLIIDRSPFEDIEVFAHYFHSMGKIDERSYGTYVELADHFLQELPVPNLLVYCYCGLSEIKARLGRRNDKKKNFYPHGHIEAIHRLYTNWFHQFRHCPACSVDSKRYDFRVATTAKKIAAEITALLTRPPHISKQLTLPSFGDHTQRNIEYEVIREVVPIEKALSTRQFRAKRRISLAYPSAYIAAPFTSQASDLHSDTADQLFDFDRPHGLIPKGPYRKVLNAISRTLKSMGFSVILPHRDINEWGKRILPAKKVFSLCTETIQGCDLFVGLLGLSHGTHYEFGIASGLGKPCILISAGDVPHSFISNGVQSDQDRILLLNCEHISQAASMFCESQTMEFIRTFFPLGEVKR